MPRPPPHPPPERAAPSRWPSPFPPPVAFRQAGAGEAEALLPEGRALLPDERALLGGQAAARRVREFTLGRACARAALAALVPARAAELAATPILREDARRPRWPAGFVGAITHHRGSAAAAVALATDCLGLGLDLEAVRAPSPALLRRILRPEERARWEALPAAEQPAAFVRAFSAKESVFKALYPLTGVYLGFQDAAIEDESGPAVPGEGDPPAGDAAGAGPVPGRRRLRWRLTRACGADFPAGYEGTGCALEQGGFVLTAVWVWREGPA